MAAPPTDTGWPQTHEKDGQTVVIFQPQVDQWKDQTRMDFRAAIAVTPRGAAAEVYGVVEGRADTEVNPDSRTVYLSNLQLDIRFPGQDESKTRSLQAVVQDLLSAQSVVSVSLDRVLACVKAQHVKPATVQVNLDPPPIHYSDSPAILVIFTGPPQFKPIKGTQLDFAVNTNWDLIKDQATSQYYLLDGESWLTAPDPTRGPWTAAGTLPADLSNLPADANWEEVQKHVPGQATTNPPKVIASTEPCELIVTDGKPRAAPIPGTTLEHIVNPPMPLFYNKADRFYYYLVAGRWFRTNNLNGGWQAASARLPDDFAKIPPDGPVGYVLASVPGTEEAKDAILLSSIPHKATINIKAAKVTVTYDGSPQFVPIEGTAMTYAVNTSNQVIFAEGQYYCCYQGVWFVGPAPTGPWSVVTKVPAVIYTIPPSSPVYNCTYVQVYSATPTTVVVGYTSGYSGEYVAATGALMFGAGMLAGAAIAGGYYNPCYYSYGCAARYDYAYGSYYKSTAYYGPYGGAGCSANYNSATGTYSRSAYAYGPSGSAHVQQAYNPYTGANASHAGATNGYQSWGHTTASADGKWATAGHQTTATGASTGWVQTSGGKGGTAYQTQGGATVARSKSGEVYAGKDGNVYRKSPEGEWQQHSGGSWQNVSHPSQPQGQTGGTRSTQSELDHEASSRYRGNYQASRTQSFRGGGGGRRR